MADHRRIIVALDEGARNANAVAIDADGLDDGALAPLPQQQDIFTPDADRHAR